MATLVATAGLLGAIIGSFLTVVVRRIGTSETIVYGRSHCIHCGKNLTWYELLPVVSFIAQGGRCRLCKGAIPRTYLAIELVTALSFGSIAWGVSSGTIISPPFACHSSFVICYSLSFFYYAFFAGIAIAISFYDYLHQLIPNALIAPLALVGASATIAGFITSGDMYSFLISLALACCLFLVFWCLWFFSKGRGMGRGDADVAFAIALYLGPFAGALGVIFSFWLGTILGVLLMLKGGFTLKSKLPFAPFLFAGATSALFFTPAVSVYFANIWWP